MVSDCRFTDNSLDLLCCWLFALEIFLKKFFVLLYNMLDKLASIFLSKLLHIFRDFLNLHILAHIIIIDISLHLYEVDNTLKSILSTDRKLNWNSITLKAILHHFYNTVEVRTHNIHLIDIYHAWNAIFVSLSPNSFGLRLNATLCTKNCYRAIENSQRTLNLNCKVNVSWGVYDIDSVLTLIVVASAPEASSSSRCNCNTSFLLLYHPVHSSRAIMSLADFMVDTGVEKDTFCCCCFTSIDMSHDADITSHFK